MAEFLTTPFGTLVIVVVQVLLIVAFVMISLLFLVYGDRKIWAAVQMRRGPNVVGPWGLLQSVADALKYVVKEVVIPAGADRTLFVLAPLVSFVLAIMAWAVIPFDDTWVVADLNIAILYIFAVSSLEVYGVIMGGWASNSKYPFLGSLRSAAQMISYEVSIGLIIIGVILTTGSMNLGDIVRAQDGSYGVFSWYWLAHFPMLILFFVSALAETNRPPFDLPEAESELVAGYQVEYSSTPFLLFMAGEYITIFLMCALTSLLFFGGWLSPVPFLPDGPPWMVAKMAVFFFMFAMVKAIVPRYRYDQLMRLGWKVFLPLSLAWVVIVAFLAKFELFDGAYARWVMGG
ncbi:MAG: NADH-quinone oxidoreductase subunit NuoH [Boseongicola sp. SB0664_bin_43]|uniref:NADH-quinone oxidoreductase subunit H n=1 Tax=Boseongicola sp. SB0664_bin_43 TaxID=2604844 RepID=A0A6B0Y3J9_9RHOB|nr:NADH-quinone oxidoreductase subunit NuoH [Boseongicola sp. SB0664_bin_43]